VSAHLYAFMAWTETAVPLAFTMCVKSLLEWINHYQRNHVFVGVRVPENPNSSLDHIVSHFSASTWNGCLSFCHCSFYCSDKQMWSKIVSSWKKEIC
jgi:hypothetical protein